MVDNELLLRGLAAYYGMTIQQFYANWQRP